MTSADIPAISVIVAFHNAADTIGRTLQSFAEQCFDSVEYLFVDDGSTDRTVGIINEFMASNPFVGGRYRLIGSDVRKGLACASTLGVKHSRGIYVMRCDADDYLASDALSMMWETSGYGAYDAVFAPYVRVRGSRCRSVKFRRVPDGLNDMPLDTLHFSLCNKLLRRRILEDKCIVAFEGIDCWEDLGVVSRFMSYNPKIAVMDVPTYYYVAGRTLSTSANGRLLREHLMMAMLLEQWFIEHGMDKKYAEFLNHLKFISKVRYMRGRNKDVAKWKNTFPEVNEHILGLRHVKWYWRLLFRMVSVLPVGTLQKVADMCDVFYSSPEISESQIKKENRSN